MRDHIVKPRADEEHDVGLAERQIASTEEAAGMVLWHYPPPLWRGVEGNAGLVDKLFECGGGVRPQNTTARDNDWPLGTGQHVDGLLHQARVAQDTVLRLRRSRPDH